MTRRPVGDEGAAALEMALVLGLLLALASLVAPLGIVLYESVQLGRAAGDTIRFATSRTGDDRVIAGGSTVTTGRLPTDDQVIAEAQKAHRGLGAVTMDVTDDVFSTDDPSCASARRRTVTLRTSVSLGPFSGLLPGSLQELEATATSCQE